MDKDLVPLPSYGSKAAANGMFLGLSQIVRLLLTTLSTVIIARLLLPGDFGVIAMAAPVTGFIVMFQDLGLSAATIQKPSISDEQSNVMFWINILGSAVIAALLVALSPMVGWFYDDRRAAYVTAATAITVLAAGPAIQQSALLSRKMRFSTLSGIDIASAVAMFFVATFTAFYFRSYWALVLGTFAGTVVQTTVTWMVTPWRPRKPVWSAGILEFARFGGHVTGYNIANFLARNADNVLIARFLGSGPLGLYDRSYKLMMLPLQAINAPIARLLVPMLSRLQDDQARYRRTFLFALRIVTLATVPGIAVATSISGQLMLFLLGNRWAGAGPIFFWLGLSAVLQPVANMTGVLFLSGGHTKNYMRYGLFSSFVTVVGFVVGLNWGVIGVSISLLVTVLVRIPFLFAISVVGTSVRQRDLYIVQAEAIFGALIVGVGTTQIARWLTVGPLLCIALPLAYLMSILITLCIPDGRVVIEECRRLAIRLVIDNGLFRRRPPRRGN